MAITAGLLFALFVFWVVSLYGGFAIWNVIDTALPTHANHEFNTNTNDNQLRDLATLVFALTGGFIVACLIGDPRISTKTERLVAGIGLLGIGCISGVNFWVRDALISYEAQAALDLALIAFGMTTAGTLLRWRTARPLLRSARVIAIIATGIFGIAVPAYFATNLLLIRFHVLDKPGGGVQGLSAIQYVTSGLTLIAFVVAIAFNAYRLKLKNTADILEKIPKEDRLKAVSVQAEMLHLDIEKGRLTGPALERVVLEQLRLKERRNLVYALLAVVLAFLLAIVAIVAIVVPRTSQAANVDAATGVSNVPLIIKTITSATIPVAAAETQPCTKDDCANRIPVSVTLPPGARYMATHYFANPDKGALRDVGSTDFRWGRFSDAATETNHDGQIVVTTYYYNRSTENRLIAIKVDYR
jgi:hypothetical protein